MWKLLKKGQPQDLEEMILFMEGQESINKSNSVKVKCQQNGNQSENNKQNWQKGSSRKLRDTPVQTQNTTDCKIYNEDGTRKRKSKSQEGKKSLASFAQFKKRIDKMLGSLKEVGALF
jgi:hypothetical protein